MSEQDFSYFSLVRADLARHRQVIVGRPGPTPTWKLLPAIFSPRFASVLLCRTAHSLARLHLGLLARVVSFLNFTVFGIEIALRCRIGPGLVLPHTQGTVIGAASIGADAIIFHGVTLGARELDMGYTSEARPVVGDGVVIGAGAKVLGGLQLGDRCRIGANAVVLESVPAGALAVGVPARVVALPGGTP